MRRERLAVTVWDDATPGAPRVVMVPGPLAPGPETFAGQRPLAELFRLELVAPPRVGGSRDGSREGAHRYWADLADELTELLGHGAHLVGHCLGGLSALRAAAGAPQAVRSLTLIEPCALRVSGGRLVAAEREPEAADAGRSPDVPDLPDWLGGAPGPPHGTARDAAPYDLGVRPGTLVTADWPKLIVNGAPDRRDGCAHPTPRCQGEQLADAVGARHLRVDDAGHAPQRDRPGPVNVALRRLWQG